MRLALSGLVVVIALVWVAGQCGSPGPTTSATGRGSTSTRSAPPTTRHADTLTAPQGVTVETLAQLLPGPMAQSDAVTTAGKVMLIGGVGANRSSLDVVWRFDPATGATTDLGRTPRPLHDSTVEALGTTVFDFGGREGTATLDGITMVKPGSANAVPLADAQLPSPRAAASGVSEPDGSRVYIVGGDDGRGPTNDILATTDGSTFTTVGVLSEPVRYPAVALQGTTLWVLGGTWNDQSTATIQKVDLSSGVATIAGAMPVPLSRASAFVLDGTVFVAGGRNANGRTDTVSRFDPDTLALTAVAKLPTPSADMAVAVVDGAAYLFGGGTPQPTRTVLKLTPA